MSAIRAQGAGGQNVNKVSSAVHLRFDVASSSLPEAYKQRLLTLRDKRITKDGVIVIKSQQHRSLEKNRSAALDRLQELIKSVFVTQAPRVPTKATRASKKRRLESKGKRGKVKALRRRVDHYSD
jgi:ribosome-associated protein